jgi:hypothetical protein
MRTYQDELSHSRARHCACMTMCQHSRDSLFRERASWRPCPPAASPLPPLELPPARLRRIWRRRCVRLPPIPRASRRPFRVPGDRRRSVRRERADPAARVGPRRAGAGSAVGGSPPWAPRTRVSDSYLILIHDVELEETHMAPTVAGLSLSLFFRSDVAAAASHGAHGAVSSVAAIAHWGTHESASESSHIVADRTGPSPVGHALPVAASFAVPTPAEGGRARLFRNGLARLLRPLGREWRTI